MNASVILRGLLLGMVLFSASGATAVQLSIGDCKKLPDKSAVETDYAIVTAVFPDSFYIEQSDRSCGIRVSASGSGHTVGDVVSVSGTMLTGENCERFIDLLTESGAQMTTGIPPVFMKTAAVGGADWHYDAATGAGQQGLPGQKGLNTVGLLVRVCGSVSEIEPVTPPAEPRWFTLYDASGAPLKVRVPPGVSVKSAWQHVVVTGICSLEVSGEKVRPVILVRNGSDIATNGNILAAALIPRPGRAAPGQTIRFDGLLSTSGMPGRSIEAYEWDFDYNGVTFDVNATGPEPSHSYSEFGTYTVALRVRDTDAETPSDTATALVTVDQGNLPPIAAPGGPYYVSPGESLTLNAGASSDPNAPAGDSVASYAWDANGDGVFDSTSANASVTLAWTQLQALGIFGGTRTVALRVTDEFGAHSSKSTPLYVYSADPVPVFTMSSTVLQLGNPVSLNAAASYHPRPDREIVSYEWDFDYLLGDSFVAEAAGVTQSFTPLTPGTHGIALRVTDNSVPPRTAIAFQTINVTMINTPPTAACGGPYAIDKGSSLSLNGTGSYDPDTQYGDRIIAYRWDLNGDGTYNDATGAKPALTWAQLQGFGLDTGTHTVRLQVTDAFGATSVESGKLTIYDNQPVARITCTPNPAPLDYTIVLDGTGSSHNRPDRSIVAYEWDMSYDGVTFNAERTGAATKISYPVAGAYTVALRVRDDNSPARSSLASTVILVKSGNVPPVAAPGGPYVINTADSLELDGTNSFDPNTGDTVISYQWDLNNDGIYKEAEGSKAVVSWRVLSGILSAGIHTVGLKVTDAYGATATATTQLTVYNNVPVPVIAANPPEKMGGGESLYLDASDSYHDRPDREIVNYEWDFDYNGVTFAPDAMGKTANHIYNRLGTFTVALRVTDNNSPAKTALATKNVSVEPRNAPTAVHGGPYVINVGDSLHLDGRASYDADAPFGDSIVTYAWDFNSDGTYEWTGAYVTITWTQLQSRLQVLGLPDAGRYYVALRVMDTTGRTHTAAAPLTIYLNQPTARIDASTPHAAPGQTISLSAAGSSHGRPDRQIVSYEWDFDYNGAVFAPDAVGLSVTHAYPAFGTYACALRVTDDNSPARTSIATVSISADQGNLAPVAHPGHSYTINAGSLLALDGSLSWEPNAAAGDSIVNYAWDLDNDGFYGDAVGVQPTLVWAQLSSLGLSKGIHTVWLEVTDSFGARGRSYTRLEIR